MVYHHDTRCIPSKCLSYTIDILNSIQLLLKRSPSSARWIVYLGSNHCMPVHHDTCIQWYHDTNILFPKKQIPVIYLVYTRITKAKSINQVYTRYIPCPNFLGFPDDSAWQASHWVVLVVGWPRQPGWVHAPAALSSSSPGVGPTPGRRSLTESRGVTVTLPF